MDADGDGHPDAACGGSDCDDADALRFPGNTEVCDPDHRDEDCDPRTFGFRDADGDAAPDARCCNGDVCGSDCDDARPDVHPMGPELCDERDNDCDGVTDEERVFVDWYPDNDGDLFGDGEAAPIRECTPVPGRVSNPDDCNDERTDIHPGGTERCDGVDQDCDDVIGEEAIVTFYPDDDADGFGRDEDTLSGCAEALPEGYALEGGDCVDLPVAGAPHRPLRGMGTPPRAVPSGSKMHHISSPRGRTIWPTHTTDRLALGLEMRSL